MTVLLSYAMYSWTIGRTEGGVSLGYIGGFPGTAEIADLNSESDDEEIAQTTAADAAEAAELAEYVTKKSVVGGRYLVWYCNLKPGDETWKYVSRCVGFFCKNNYRQSTFRPKNIDSRTRKKWVQ